MAATKQIRVTFRVSVFQRDRYRCVMCGKAGKDQQGGDRHRAYHDHIPKETLVPLDAHHITDRRG